MGFLIFLGVVVVSVLHITFKVLADIRRENLAAAQRPKWLQEQMDKDAAEFSARMEPARAKVAAEIAESQRLVTYVALGFFVVLLAVGAL